MNANFAGGWAGWDAGDEDVSEDGSSPHSHYLTPGQIIKNDFVLSLNVRSLTSGSKTDAICDLIKRTKIAEFYVCKKSGA